jgi:hypothetical protein
MPFLHGGTDKTANYSEDILSRTAAEIKLHYFPASRNFDVRAAHPGPGTLILLFFGTEKGRNYTKVPPRPQNKNPARTGRAGLFS